MIAVTSHHYSNNLYQQDNHRKGSLFFRQTQTGTLGFATTLQPQDKKLQENEERIKTDNIRKNMKTPSRTDVAGAPNPSASTYLSRRRRSKKPQGTRVVPLNTA